MEKINKKIKWIFFDIGGVLRDETEYYIWQERRLIEISQEFNPKITKKDFLKARITASSMPGWLNANILEILIGDRQKAEEQRQGLEVEKEKVLNSLLVRPDTLKVVSNLSKKYSLSIISNEHSTIISWLEKEELLNFFNIIGIPDKYKLQKPNPEFFKTVLKDAKANFKESVMIDDNIERGLQEAKALGMTTVFFNATNRQDISKDIVDFTVYSLTDLLKVF